MKKSRLVANFSFDFSLLAAVSQLKEYKLAWLINRTLRLELAKCDDVTFEFLGKGNLSISNFLFQTEHSSLRLLKNRSYTEGALGHSFLIPELKKFDYLIMIQGFEDSFTLSQIMERLREMEGLQFLKQIDVQSLKSKENLIF